MDNVERAVKLRARLPTHAEDPSTRQVARLARTTMPADEECVERTCCRAMIRAHELARTTTPADEERGLERWTAGPSN